MPRPQSTTAVRPTTSSISSAATVYQQPLPQYQRQQMSQTPRTSPVPQGPPVPHANAYGGIPPVANIQINQNEQMQSGKMGPNISNVYIDVVHAGKVYSILLDSGCDRSIAPRRYFRGARVECVDDSASAANGDHIHITGRTRFPFEIKGKKMYADLLSLTMLRRFSWATTG